MAGRCRRTAPSTTRCRIITPRRRHRPINANVLQRLVDVDVDVVDLRAQADASMPASNNNVKLYNISNF